MILSDIYGHIDSLELQPRTNVYLKLMADKLYESKDSKEALLDVLAFVAVWIEKTEKVEQRVAKVVELLEPNDIY